MKKNSYRKIALIGSIGIALVVFFQNCGKTGGPGQSFNPNNPACSIHNVDMDESQLCFRINEFEGRLCWNGSNYAGPYDSTGQLDTILRNMHGCRFAETGSTARVESFTVNQTGSNYHTTSAPLSHAIEVPINLSVNADAVDEYFNYPRLLSFASVIGTDYCTYRNSKLHRVTLDESGSVQLSDDPDVACGELEDQQLSCVYKAMAQQQGCTFHLTLWSYDESYRIAPSGTSIHIQMVETTQ